MKNIGSKKKGGLSVAIVVNIADRKRSGIEREWRWKDGEEILDVRNM